jgi:hypothetical protein
MTLAQVFDAPEFAGLSLDAILKLLRVSLAVGETFVRYGAAQPRATADRLNAVLLTKAERGEALGALASPRMGGGAGISVLDELMLAALHEKADPVKALTRDIDELIARVSRSLVATGLRLQVGGAEVSPEDTTTRLRHIFEDSGEKLIAHSEGLDLLPVQKTSKRQR